MEPSPDSSGDVGRPLPSSELCFPDMPRLELDTLLHQLVERAQEVIGTQGRLRGLLRAQQAIISDLSRTTVLRRIVEAAQELVGARYAALGVIAADGHLAEFVHTGMPDDEVARIGGLPQGKGLLGALIDDPAPIRLAELTSDQRSSGVPPGHPRMHSFLGVPITVRDTAFGNLYLADAESGEFSSEDQELVTALAASAGMVIENSRLLEASRTRQRWLEASSEITRRLLAPDDVAVLDVIAQLCREVSGADLVAVVLPVQASASEVELRVHTVIGPAGLEDLHGLVLTAETFCGQVFATGTPQLSTASLLVERSAATAAGLGLGPVLAVPLQGAQRRHGVLVAARGNGSSEFAAGDLDMAADFANHASVAIELAGARAEQQRAAMLDERERIAADLHDHVIQRLFATGLSLGGLADQVPAGAGRERLDAAVDDLDAVVRQIRSTIFDLHVDPSGTQLTVGAVLTRIARDCAPALGFTPRTHVDEALEDPLPPGVLDDLSAVVREALTNVARHARAGIATVRIVRSGGRVTAEVTDDGVGLGDEVRRSGLRNLRRRAEHREGTLTLRGGVPRGTVLSWSIPVP